MKFIYKCYLQRLFSKLPRGEKLNYVFQRYVTHSLPAKDDKFLQKVARAKEHLQTFAKHTKLCDARDSAYYEFGAGWDLINPIALSLLGLRRLHCVDIRDLAFPELLNDTISKFRRLRREVGITSAVLESVPRVTIQNFREILATYLGIKYEAPLDARRTNIESSTIDFICSNVTLEHIPRDSILQILQECCRISKTGGIASFTIDYSDHWSHFDRSISIYNFLKYSPAEWRKYSPSLLYQNRLRHKDYLEIIGEVGFEVLEENPVLPTEQEMDILRKLTLNVHFSKRYTYEELAIRGAKIVLRK